MASSGKVVEMQMSGISNTAFTLPCNTVYYKHTKTLASTMSDYLNKDTCDC